MAHDIMQDMEKTYGCSYTLCSTSTGVQKQIDDEPYLSKIYAHDVRVSRKDLGYTIDFYIIDPSGTVETEDGPRRVVKHKRNISLATGWPCSAVQLAERLEHAAGQIREQVKEWSEEK